MKLKNIKNRKNIIKLLSVFLVTVLITVPLIKANAKEGDIPDKPSFNVSGLSVTPDNPVVGEDITVKGELTPHDFKCDIPQKEIVLVLDTSGSMSGNKIKKMKIAAESFIHKMEKIPNLNIDIVTYSDTGYTYLDSGNIEQELISIIDSIKADGGTNTGEGLRKAAYILELEENKNADKSIVFMSDGVPTYYSILAKYHWWDIIDIFPYKSYYTNIDNEKIHIDNHILNILKANPRVEGTGYEEEDNIRKSIKYATKIGNIISSKGYNIFSIGYGLGNENSQENALMKKIHESMGGSTGKEGTFFASDENAIDGVFNNIADKIINGYTIKDIKVNLNLDKNLSLNLGGNTVNINNIKYTRDESQSTNCKVVYHAEPVPFSFIIKGKMPGSYDNIFKDSFISIPWNNENLKINMHGISLNIEENKLPDINAELKIDNSAANQYKVNSDVNLTYTVTPQHFKFNNNSESNSPKDVVILLDTSSAMKNKLGENSGSEKHPQKTLDGVIEQGIVNKLFKNDELQNLKTRYSIITYCDKVHDTSIDDIDIECNSESDYAEKMKKNVLDNIYISDSDKRDIVGALKLGEQILDDGIREPFTSKIDENRGAPTKNMIIIGGDSINLNENGLNNEIESIKNKKYNNVITANLGDIRSENKEPNNNLKKLHYKLIGKEDNGDNILEKKKNNYFINVNYKEIDVNNPDNIFTKNQSINSNNFIEEPIISDISKRLKGQGEQVYNFETKLKFSIGSNFNVKSGLNKCNEESYTYETNPINIRYEFAKETGQYQAVQISNSFVIQPTLTGELGFGTNNDIIYSNLIGNKIKKPIITPKISVEDNLKHGIYKGIDETDPKNSNNPIIDEAERTFSKETKVPLAAAFKYSGESKLILNINDIIPLSGDNGTIEGDIKVYKVINGTLEVIGKMENESDKYTFNMPSNVNLDEQILILYFERFNKSLINPTGNYQNIIKLYKGNNIDETKPTETKQVTINVSDMYLPELF